MGYSPPAIISRSSKPAIPAGNVFRLYLSLIWSPGRFLVQNLLVWSLEPEHKMCPSGCQDKVHTILSWACSMAPTSLSALKNYIIVLVNFQSHNILNSVNNRKFYNYSKTLLIRGFVYPGAWLTVVGLLCLYITW